MLSISDSQAKELVIKRTEDYPVYTTVDNEEEKE